MFQLALPPICSDGNMTPRWTCSCGNTAKWESSSNFAFAATNRTKKGIKTPQVAIGKVMIAFLGCFLVIVCLCVLSLQYHWRSIQNVSSLSSSVSWDWLQPLCIPGWMKCPIFKCLDLNSSHVWYTVGAIRIYQTKSVKFCISIRSLKTV